MTNMTEWEIKLVKELEIIIRFNVSKLCKIISTLNIVSRQKWIDTWKEEINEACVLLVEEAAFFVSIQHLKQRCVQLSNMLQIEVLPYDSENLTLYQEKKFLERRLTEYEGLVEERQNNLRELNLKQLELCKLLEKTPMVFVEKVIPSESELKHLSLEVENLTKEYDALTKQFYETKLNIECILQQLKLEMHKDIKRILSVTHQTSINKEILCNLTEYYRGLQQKYNYEILKPLKEVLSDLYNTCHIAEIERKFVMNSQQCSLQEIQREITVLKNYRSNNENQFVFLANYKKIWENIAKYVQNYKSSSKKSLESIKIFCKQLHEAEEQLLNSTIEYEQQNKKAFTTFGQTIPGVIGYYHSTYGRCTISKGNMRKLTDIITQYNVESTDLSTSATSSSNLELCPTESNITLNIAQSTSATVETRNISKVMSKMNSINEDLSKQIELKSLTLSNEVKAPTIPKSSISSSQSQARLQETNVDTVHKLKIENHPAKNSKTQVAGKTSKRYTTGRGGKKQFVRAKHKLKQELRQRLTNILDRHAEKPKRIDAVQNFSKQI